MLSLSSKRIFQMTDEQGERPPFGKIPGYDNLPSYIVKVDWLMTRLCELEDQNAKMLEWCKRIEARLDVMDGRRE